MRRIQSSSLLLALAVALVPLACSQETPTDTDSQKAEATAAPKVAEVEPGKLGKGKGMGDKMGRRGKGKFGRDRGPAAKLLSTALSDLELSAEQKEKISALKPEKGDKGDRGDKKESREAMQKALSEAVKTGKVDAKIFETQMAAMQERHQAKQVAQAKLLNDLHAALEPAQRTALVAKVKEKNAERAKQMEAMKAKWEEKAKAGDDAEGAADGKRGKRGHKGMRGGKGHGGKMGMAFAHFGKDLELTEAQQKQVDALKEKAKADMPERPDMKKMHAEMETRTNALLDAFAKDDFDATKLELGHGKKEAPKFADHVTRMNEFLAILTADQRGKLAERIANPPKRMHKGMEMKKGMRGGDRPEADDGDDFGLPDLDSEIDEMEDDIIGEEAAE